MMKTPVTVLLDAHGISYHQIPHDHAMMTMEAAVQQRGMNPEEIIKCILLRDKQQRFVMACLSGFDKLNTQAVRAYVTMTRLTFASPDEIQSITGFTQGAVAPIAHKTALPIVFDNNIQSERVTISSGNHQLSLELTRQDLTRVVDHLIWGDIHATA